MVSCGRRKIFDTYSWKITVMPAFQPQPRDIEWLSCFVAMLYEEYEEGVITEKTLQFGLNLVQDKAIE